MIDPRAGHGPGIGGFKIDSEIGIALKVGHPCYFVMFYPQPVPGQTIESVCAAEAEFMRKVNELHPDAEGKPFVIGNCQGGWALMMLAALAPQLVGPILLAGSPISYWAGVAGKNPMRYSGGLLGRNMDGFDSPATSAMASSTARISSTTSRTSTRRTPTGASSTTCTRRSTPSASDSSSSRSGGAATTS